MINKEDNWDSVKHGIMGFGDGHSSHKMYYPELRKQIVELAGFRKLMDNVSDIIFQIDISNDKIVYANNSAVNQIKMKYSDILDSSILNYVSDDLYKKILNTESGNIKEQNIISNLKDIYGELLPVEINYQFQEIEGKKYAIIIARNIQERVSAQKALYESDQSMKNVYNNIYDIVVIHSDKGIIIEANSQALLMFGASKDELIGMHVRNFSAKTEQIDLLPGIFEKAMSGEYLVFEWLGKKVYEEEYFHIEVALRKISWFGEEVVLSVMRDISSRKRLEENLKQINLELEDRVNQRTYELRSALEELKKENETRKQIEQYLTNIKDELSKALEKEKELNELKSRFVSMVSHEYRTPLTVILSSTYLLDVYYQKKKDSEFSKHIYQIQNSVQEMTKMLNDVLSIGKINSGKFVFNYEEFSLREHIYRLVESFKDIDGGMHNFLVSVPEEECMIKSDYKSISSIMNNIVGNAIKYSPNKSNIYISLAIENNYKITVKDMGIGINDKDLDKVFEPFFRAPNSEPFQGSGLGLSIVKSLLDQLNGNIKVVSKLGKGSSFIIKLPKE
jgi:PAS domain S-box-containing protein